MNKYERNSEKMELWSLLSHQYTETRMTIELVKKKVNNKELIKAKSGWSESIEKQKHPKTYIVMKGLYKFIDGKRPKAKNICKCQAEFPNLKERLFQKFIKHGVLSPGNEGPL